MAGRQPGQEALDRWREFANQYIIDFDGTAALQRCTGYTATGQAASVTSCRLLKKPEVQQFIREATEARMARLELSQDNVVLEQLRIAMSDIRNYMKWDESGTKLIPSHELTEDAARAVEMVEYWEDESISGDVKRKMKFKLHSKTTALEQLAKHLGMYTEKREYHHTFGSVEVPAMANPEEWEKVIDQQTDEDTTSDSNDNPI